MKSGDRNLVLAIVILTVITQLWSCANVGNPNGGPYDEKPPKFVSSVPAPNQTKYHGKKVEILFDELIQIDKPQDNVIITPPQLMQPVIKTLGKKVSIELKDSLLENATYTIDFTSSLADYNEKNILENYSFAFSTGDSIDSLQVSGTLLYANNLEPASGITIGLHSNLADSAFQKVLFYRTSRTNDRGHFTIRNIKPGSYHIFALKDQNGNYRFDQKSEEIAWSDSLIIPTFKPDVRHDTIWKDTVTVDSIRTVDYTHFLPDDIQLRLFTEDFERKYMTRPERNDQRTFLLNFNSIGEKPQIDPVNFTPTDSAWYFVQNAKEGKSLLCWVTDSTVWKQDTLRMAVTYLKTDTAFIDHLQTDTIAAVYKHVKEKKKKKDEVEEAPAFNIGVTAANAMEMSDTVKITLGEPVLMDFRDSIHFEQMIDSVWTAVPFTIEADTTDQLKFFVYHKWNYGEDYRITIDSAAVRSVYGSSNLPVQNKFKIQPEETYGHLFVNVLGLPNDSLPAFAELLNATDVVVRRAEMKNGGVLFMDLKPDKYYVRLTVDENHDGIWTPGNYAAKKQPETVYYCPRVFKVMQNWQMEESWDVTQAAFDKQKPLEITKNKPKDTTKKKRDYKDEGKNTSSSSRNNSFGGASF